MQLSRLGSACWRRADVDVVNPVHAQPCQACAKQSPRLFGLLRLPNPLSNLGISSALVEPRLCLGSEVDDSPANRKDADNEKGEAMTFHSCLVSPRGLTPELRGRPRGALRDARYHRVPLE